jgi:hypothetical protein
MTVPITWLSDRMDSRLLCTAGSVLIVFSNFSLRDWIWIPRSHASSFLGAFRIRVGVLNSPNQSAILVSVPRDKVGTASGMNTAAARTGRAMGVALSATLFTYGLTAAGLVSPLKVVALHRDFRQFIQPHGSPCNLFTLLPYSFP